MLPAVHAGRRGFLAAMAWAAAACRPHPRHAGEPKVALADPGSAPAGDPMRAALQACEEVLGVHYTEDERAQIAKTLDEQLALSRARSGLEIPNALAPALRFDPRLPGFSAPPAGPWRYADPPRGRPESDVDLAYASIDRLGAWLRDGTVTSRRLTEIYLQRCRTHGRALEAIVTLTEELALRQADRADAELRAGRPRGPLHGIPWVAKDLFDTAGVPTTWGAEPFATRTPERDATVVQRLEAAGAVLLGKVSLGALAYGDIWFGGTTRNPWNPREGSSGSSAGSAACVAAGLAGFALGTETLGSIVSPAMRCGATGLRPTFGRVARGGAMALCWSLDKIGPLARSAEDCMRVLAAIDGAHASDPSSIDVPLGYDATRPLAGIRVGIVPQWLEAEGVHSIDRAAIDAVRDLGATVVERPPLPDLPYPTLYLLLFAEAAAAFEELTRTGQDDALRWQDPEAWPNTFRRARFVSAIDLVQADRVRRLVMEALHDAFAEVDVLVGPSFAGSMLLATNMSGHPCGCLRAGLVERAPDEPLSWPAALAEPAAAPRVPHGITLWGRLFDEGTLVRVAAALEAALGVAAERPPLFT
jgi:Asp-tRNA(Asn)/Glu-tRNA(Gln) amidotransferase A subunit family amidase